MPRGQTKSAKAGPLSHSSAQTLLGCEQKYVHYKVKHTPSDSDYKKSGALAIGSAFHWILESTKHEKPEKISELLDKCTTDEDIQLDPKDIPLVHAMVVKYLRLHKRMGFKVLEVEFELKTESVIGYVDALIEDLDGKWWILDLKTAKTFYTSNIPKLPLDPQLNLYASQAEDIARRFDLDIESFGGCRWRVATKPTLKLGKKETIGEYTKRLLDRVAVHDVAVPIEVMNPEETLARHTELWKLSKKMYTPKAAPRKNFGNCMAFFSACQYWKNCYGQNYTDTTVEVVTEV